MMCSMPCQVNIIASDDNISVEFQPAFFVLLVTYLSLCPFFSGGEAEGMLSYLPIIEK